MDERFRNAIEGKFGQAKRRFSLNLVMTKLPETSETSIAITFLVVNLSRLQRPFLSENPILRGSKPSMNSLPLGYGIGFSTSGAISELYLKPLDFHNLHQIAGTTGDVE